MPHQIAQMRCRETKGLLGLGVNIPCISVVEGRVLVKPTASPSGAASVTDAFLLGNISYENYKESPAWQLAGRWGRNNVGLTSDICRSRVRCKGSVVSDSMEHKTEDGKVGFDSFWDLHGEYYEKSGITAEQFLHFPFSEGLCMGSCIVLEERNPKEIVIGEVLAFIVQDFKQSRDNDFQGSHRARLCIHRVIKKWKDQSFGYFFSTKGDKNHGVLDGEKAIPHARIIGVGTGYCSRSSDSTLELNLHASSATPGGYVPTTTVRASEGQLDDAGLGHVSTVMLPPSADVATSSILSMSKVAGGTKLDSRCPTEVADEVDSILEDLQGKDSDTVDNAIRKLHHYRNADFDNCSLKEVEQYCRLFSMAGVYNILYKAPTGKLVTEYPEAELLLNKTLVLSKRFSSPKLDKRWVELSRSYVEEISYLLAKNRLTILDYKLRRDGGAPTDIEEDLNGGDSTDTGGSPNGGSTTGIGKDSNSGSTTDIGEDPNREAAADIEKDPIYVECLKLYQGIKCPIKRAKLDVSMALVLRPRVPIFRTSEAIANKVDTENSFGKDRSNKEKAAMLYTYQRALVNSMHDYDNTAKEECLAAYREVTTAIETLHATNTFPEHVRSKTRANNAAMKLEAFRLGGVIGTLEEAWQEIKGINTKGLDPKSKQIVGDVVGEIQLQQSVNSVCLGLRADMRRYHSSEAGTEAGRKLLPAVHHVGIMVGDENPHDYRTVNATNPGLKSAADTAKAWGGVLVVDMQAWNTVYEAIGGLAANVASVGGLGATVPLQLDLGLHVILGPFNLILATLTSLTRSKAIYASTKSLLTVNRFEVESAKVKNAIIKIAATSDKLKTYEAMATLYGVIQENPTMGKRGLRQLRGNALKIAQGLSEESGEKLLAMFPDEVGGKTDFDTEQAGRKIMKKVVNYLKNEEFSADFGELEGKTVLSKEMGFSKKDPDDIKKAGDEIARILRVAVFERGSRSNMVELKIIQESTTKMLKILDELKDGGVDIAQIHRFKRDTSFAVISAVIDIGYSWSVVAGSFVSGIGISLPAILGTTAALGSFAFVGPLAIAFAGLPLAGMYFFKGALTGMRGYLRAKKLTSRLGQITPGTGTSALAKKALKSISAKSRRVMSKHLSVGLVYSAFTGWVGFWTVGSIVALGLILAPPLAPVGIGLAVAVGIIATLGFITAGVPFYIYLGKGVISDLSKNRKVRDLQSVIVGDVEGMRKYKDRCRENFEKEIVAEELNISDVSVLRRRSLIASGKAEALRTYAQRYNAAHGELVEEIRDANEGISEEGIRVKLEEGRQLFWEKVTIGGAEVEDNDEARREAIVYKDRLHSVISDDQLKSEAMADLIELSSRAALNYLIQEARKASNGDVSRTDMQNRIIKIKEVLTGGDDAIRKHADENNLPESTASVCTNLNLELEALRQQRSNWEEVKLLEDILDGDSDLTNEVLEVTSPERAIKIAEARLHV